MDLLSRLRRQRCLSIQAQLNNYSQQARRQSSLTERAEKTFEAGTDKFYPHLRA